MLRRRFISTVAQGALAIAGAAWGPAAHAAADRGYRERMLRFDVDHPGDVILGVRGRAILGRVLDRMRRVQATVGHGHFYVLGFDAMRGCARAYDAVGAFARDEVEFLDRLFHCDARRYGFRGEKVLDRMTDEIPDREVERIPGTGHRVFRGRSSETLRRMRAAVGDRLVLTSGVRGIAKQTYLFLRKCDAAGGNLSRASRSLAPPGYSFHAVGDFDVGERGLGAANFTDAFAGSDVHRRLVDLGYAVERYPLGNPYGVRYEPWHVKVV